MIGTDVAGCCWEIVDGGVAVECVVSEVAAAVAAAAVAGTVQSGDPAMEFRSLVVGFGSVGS